MGASITLQTGAIAVQVCVLSFYFLLFKHIYFQYVCPKSLTHLGGSHTIHITRIKIRRVNKDKYTKKYGTSTGKTIIDK